MSNEAPETNADEAPENRRGRPPAGERPMTSAERQRAYRQRQRRAQIDSIGQEADASRVTLINRLAQILAVLDSDADKQRKDDSRYAAWQVMAEIVTRYEIAPPKGSR